MQYKKLIILFWFFLQCITCSSFAKDSDQQISALIQSVQGLDLSQRIDTLSSHFINVNTSLFTLGEGSAGRFDQQPIYRLDDLDCTTFIEMVMAMALSQNLADFKSIIKKIRYQNGKVDFITRNHFTGEEWIPNNIKNGYLQDITQNVAINPSNTAIASVYIDKKNWYKHLTKDRIKLTSSDSQQKSARLAELKKQADLVQNFHAKLTYIPITKIFPTNDEHKINTQVINRIPNRALVIVLRKNYPKIDEYGTHWLATHMGFAIWKNKHFYLRMASTNFNKTVDLPFTEYLSTYIDHPTVIGISIFKIIYPH